MMNDAEGQEIMRTSHFNITPKSKRKSVDPLPTKRKKPKLEISTTTLPQTDLLQGMSNRFVTLESLVKKMTEDMKFMKRELLIHRNCLKQLEKNIVQVNVIQHTTGKSLDNLRRDFSKAIDNNSLSPTQIDAKEVLETLWDGMLHPMD